MWNLALYVKGNRVPRFEKSAPDAMSHSEQSNMGAETPALMGRDGERES